MGSAEPNNNKLAPPLLLTHGHERDKVDGEPPDNGFPLRQNSKTGLRWDLFRTKTCGDDKILLDVRQMVYVFIENYDGKIGLRWYPGAPQGQVARPLFGRAMCSCGSLVAPPVASRSFQCFLLPKEKRVKSTTYFDLGRYCFPAKPKTRRKEELTLGLKLIG